MGLFVITVRLASVLLAAGVIAARPAVAEKPSWAGGKSGEKHGGREPGVQERGKGNESGGSPAASESAIRASQYFSAETQIFVHRYYGERFRSGACPPGLAKKGNGCMPPGQAKKWQLGRPLPRDVIFYDLPPQVVVQLGPVPAGHRFVRVAADILMIAVGTGMVVDAIEDIGRVLD